MNLEKKIKNIILNHPLDEAVEQILVLFTQEIINNNDVAMAEVDRILKDKMEEGI